MTAQVYQRDWGDMVEYADEHQIDWRPCEWCSGRVDTVRDVVGELGPVTACRDCGRRTVVVDAR